MLDGGILELFPSRGLDQSILVAVLLGIYVLLFFTEVFGWVWAGLVVPGYLASVFVISTAAGIAISIEAILTFALCRLISDVLSRSGAWSPLFGRDRFFALVLVSVLVRQACEIWLLPLAVGWVDRRFALDLADVHDVASFGLVLVPLVANMFWKLTVPRGVFQIGVSVAVVYLALAFVLLPYTNLSFSNLELTYENVALDFLGSAKAYMILLVGAFLAARFNLTFGWDYNGILVPSLLALSWFSPLSLLATVIESLVLLFLTRALLAAPFMRSRNFEGPRKLALVFTVGFLVKYAAGWAIGDRWPGLRLTELFGFGYVLTSLLAVKMLNTKRIGRVILPTLQVSLVAFVIGSGVAFALELVWPVPRAAIHLGGVGGATVATRPRDGFEVALAGAARPRLDASPPLSGELDVAALRRVAALWRAVERLAGGGGDRAEVRRLAESVGLRLAPFAGGLALLEAEERLALQRGLEVAAVFPGRPGPIVVVPRPRHERPAAEAAAVLCERLACRALIISGHDAGEARASSFAARRSTYQIALRELASSPVLAVRASPAVARGAPRLDQHGQLSRTIDLARLWPRPLELRWEPRADDEAGRTTRELATLRAHPDDLWDLLAGAGRPPDARQGGLEATLAEWLAASAPAAPPPSETELRVIEALAAGMLAGRAAWLPWLGRVAASLGHQLIILPDGGGPGRAIWLLIGADGGGWLALAVDPAARAPLAFEVARPRFEPGSFRIAAETFASAGGLALLVDRELSGQAPERYPDPSAPGNLATPFHAVHEAIHDALAARGGDAAVLAIRGLAARRAIDADVVVAFGTGALDPADVPPAIAALLRPDGAIGRIAPRQRIADAGLALHDLTGAGIPQLVHSRALGGVASAALWFAAPLREEYVDDDRADHLERFAAVGLATDPRPLIEILAAPWSAPRGGPGDGLGEAVRLAARYRATQDLAVLAALAQRTGRRARGVGLTAGFSPDIGLAYLVVEGPGRRVGYLIGGRERPCPPVRAVDRGAIGEAIRARCSTIEVVEVTAR